MGCFDTVWIHCPYCRKHITFQSKSGDCMLKKFHYSKAPAKVLYGIDGDFETCSKCGKTIQIVLKVIPTFIF